jgi:hypothetical protein
MATRRLFRSGAWLSAVAIGGAVACFPPDDGRAPPLDRLYFPVGVALSPAPEPGPALPPESRPPEPRWLYVANSDFDLQFNAGSVQVYDLEKLRSAVPRYCDSDLDCAGVANTACDLAATSDHEPSHWCVDARSRLACGTRGEQSPADRLKAPGRCAYLDPSLSLKRSVSIGAFVTDVVYRANPADAGRGRLFLPVRGDDTLHWIDVADGPGGVLDCGQGADGACDEDHRRGQDPAQNTRGVVLPPEPFGIAVDERGEAILTTHQSSGEVALFVNNWDEKSGPVGPTLQFVANGLPSGALAVAAVPKPALAAAFPDISYQPGFLVTFRNSAEVRLVRYFDGATSPTGFEQRPFLEASRFTAIQTNSVGVTSPGIAVDDGPRRVCEASCAGADRTCLEGCTLDVYVTNRTPATLILGETRPYRTAQAIDDLPRFYDTVPVSFGVSRVVLGEVIGRDGNAEHRVFLVCFDTRRIFVYDPTARRVETEILTGKGPHALAIDAAHGLGYVAHFTDSYVGVVDLDKRHTATYGKILLNVGQPLAPRATK